MTSSFRLKIIGFGVNTTSLWLLLAICHWLFVSNMVRAQDSVQRDQQALTVLNQTIAAGGGQELLASIQDFTETGTITYYGADQVSGNVTVKGRGPYKLKVEVELPEGKQTTVVDGEGGSLKETRGEVRPIHQQGVADPGGFTLPYLSLIAAIQDSTASIVYGGLVTHNGASTYDVRVVKVYSKEQDPTRTRGVQEARDFYIDSNTFLVTAVSNRFHFVGSRDEGVPHEVLYSNYQLENGIVTPLTIAETVRGATSFTMNLSQVTFNTGLADSDFTW